MNKEQQQHLEDLKQVYTRRLQKLELKEAEQGINTPPEMSIEIEDIPTAGTSRTQRE